MRSLCKITRASAMVACNRIKRQCPSFVLDARVDFVGMQLSSKIDRSSTASGDLQRRSTAPGDCSARRQVPASACGRNYVEMMKEGGMRRSLGCSRTAAVGGGCCMPLEDNNFLLNQLLKKSFNKQQHTPLLQGSLQQLHLSSRSCFSSVSCCCRSRSREPHFVGLLSRAFRKRFQFQFNKRS